MREVVGTTTGMILALVMAAPSWAADGAAQKPTGVDPDVIACQKVTTAEMEQFIGAPATIRETSANLCSWQSGKADAYAQVMYFAGGSEGVPAGQERAYFDQMIEGQKAQAKPGEIVKVPGVGTAPGG